MTSIPLVEKIVVLGMGGTIAGLALNASENIDYTSAQVGIEQLLGSVPGLASVMDGYELITEQVAQIDSKDISFKHWQMLVLRIRHFLMQSDVKGIVITHGTDTLEETAYFLHAVLPVQERALKPVVITCAMRPASSTTSDGPQNLLDAVAVALTPGAAGVVVVCAGTVHGPVEVQKVHPYRLDAFSSGEAGPLGYLHHGVLHLERKWPLESVISFQSSIQHLVNTSLPPRVEIVMNYAGASGDMVDALISQNEQSHPEVPPVKGLVVAATGNGTVHHDLEGALIRAQHAGIKVVLATRCCEGYVLPKPDSLFPDSKGLSPTKARVALMLALLE